MRQLIGKIPIKGQKVVEEVYLSEQTRCRECQKTVPNRGRAAKADRKMRDLR